MEKSPASPYVSTSNSSPQVSASGKASVRTIVLVAALTAVGGFLSYLLVGFTAEVVLIYVFGQWEPLSQIVPHSDTAMLGVVAFMAGLFLARFNRVPRRTWAVPFGTFAAWTTYCMLSSAPIWLRLVFGLSLAALTTLGFRLMNAASVRLKSTTTIDEQHGDSLA